MVPGHRWEPIGHRLDRVVRRPRLTTALRDRFDHRITLVTGPGGAGKTTTLALAIEDNRLDPFGTDVWFSAVEHDRDAGHLAAGLAQAFGLEPAASVAHAVDAICDAVWTKAPVDVVLIVDDVHLLGNGTGVEVLDHLVRDLPRNGHLLLAGRAQPDVAVARLRALGQVVEVGPDDLSFDDDELAELIRLRLAANQRVRIRSDDLARLPALADLHLRAGPDAGSAFLWEEVLGSLQPERRRALIRAAVADVIDDELVTCLSDGAMTADELVHGLPLIDACDDDTYRIHALLRAVLREHTSSGEWEDAALRIARLEESRGRLATAAGLYSSANDPDAVLAVARRFALLPGLRRSFQDHLVVRNLVEQHAPGSVLGDLLRAESQFGELSRTTDVTRIGADLFDAARRARIAGDVELEAVALYRSMVWISLDAPVPSEHVDRLAELAEVVPLAAQVVRYVLAERAMFAGRPADSLRLLNEGEIVDAELALVDRLGLLCSLGRPEEVGVGLTTADLAGMPDGAELYVGFALWTRGQLTPEVALPIALTMMAQTLARRVVHPIVAILGVTSFMALAGGDADTALRHVALARDEETYGCSAHIRAFTDMAAAAVALETDGEQAARGVCGEMLAKIPMGAWPIRAYLLGLPMIYLLRPETRPTLDRCAFGPAIDVARDAGRTLASIRDEASVDAAAALPWDREANLRAHVLPVHLCELAVAASLAGNERAADLLGRLPGLRTNLERVASVSVPVIVEAARGRLEALPRRSLHRISVTTLGPLRISRDSNPIVEPDWSRRARVREMMGLLVEERRITRSRVAAALWPGLTEENALRNVRVTLSYLQRILEPDRPQRAEPCVVRTPGDELVLDDDIEVDADVFAREMERATEHDRAGAPGSALAIYRGALARYEGDYLHGLDGEWLEPTRARMHLLALSGFLRVGELELASGEPDRAAAWAARAESLSPGNERAARLRATCLAGAGDRLGAVGVLRSVVERLAVDGVEPEGETRRMLDRYKSA